MMMEFTFDTGFQRKENILWSMDECRYLLQFFWIVKMSMHVLIKVSLLQGEGWNNVHLEQLYLFYHQHVSCDVRTKAIIGRSKEKEILSKKVDVQ